MLDLFYFFLSSVSRKCLDRIVSCVIKDHHFSVLEIDDVTGVTPDGRCVRCDDASVLCYPEDEGRTIFGGDKLVRIVTGEDCETIGS